jgi:hypothetical protein
MMRFALRRLPPLVLVALVVLVVPAAADVGLGFIPPPIGSFDGQECGVFVHDSSGAIVGTHSEFEGTFTAVPYLGSGTFLYDVTGPVLISDGPMVGTWSMFNADGSIGGSAVVTIGEPDLVPPGTFEFPVKLQLTMDPVAGRTGIGLTIFGGLVGKGTRLLTGGSSCGFTLDVSGTLYSSLHRVKCRCEA